MWGSQGPYEYCRTTDDDDDDDDDQNNYLVLRKFLFIRY
jgi:hypothetical protein